MLISLELVRKGRKLVQNYSLSFQLRKNLFNQFHVSSAFLHPPKMSENIWFSGVFTKGGGGGDIKMEYWREMG